MELIKSGFTLIELLVVAAVVISLSAILVLYTSGGRQQIALYVEENKIIQEVLKAKSLSVATYYSSPNPTCGYGIHVNYSNGTYALFSYKPDPTQGLTCNSITQLVTAGAESDIEVFPLDANLSFGNSTNRLDYVLFLPPNPDTLMAVDMNPTVQKNISGNIPLKTRDGSAAVNIVISSAGQVTF